MREMNLTSGKRAVETEFGFEWVEDPTYIYGCLYILMSL